MAHAKTLGQTIRHRRLEMGLTQEQLAIQIGDGVRQAEVSRLENDRIVLPRRQRLERIASALNLSMGDLLAGSGWTGAELAFRRKGDVPGDQTPSLSQVTSAESAHSQRLRIHSMPDLDGLRVAIEQSRDIQLQTEKVLQSANAVAAIWNAGPRRQNKR